MSRVINCPIQVWCNIDGEPVSIRLDPRTPLCPVLSRFSHWREWIGVLDGEPERDVWTVETTIGICELHHIRFPDGNESGGNDTQTGDWILARWED